MNLTYALMLWLVIGGAVGWVASMAMSTGRRQSTFFDSGVGVLGALTAGLTVHHFFSRRLGDDLFLVSLGAAVTGACALIALWRLLASRKKRSSAA